jgi:hypothetical protein
MKYEVFICYKNYSADDLSIRLREALLDNGIDAFVDRLDIPTRYQAQEKWERYRDEAICNCDTFLMIVTVGFGSSPQIIKEIKLAGENHKDIMCFRWSKLKPELMINLGDRILNTKDIQQIEFCTSADLVRQFFDYYERPKAKSQQNSQIASVTHSQEKAKEISSTVEISRPVSYEITQSIGNTSAQRVLPDVGFNIQNWSEDCLKAWVKVRVLLGGRDLGLIKGSKRNEKYLGYYNGETVWNLNPYYGVFGHFTLPHECVDSSENLTLIVNTTFETTSGRKIEYLPIAWTYDRKTNSWFIEPTTF